MLHLPDAKGNMKGWKPTQEWMNAFEVMAKLQLTCGIGAMTMDGSGLVHEFLQPYVGRLAGWQGHTRADSLDVDQVKDQAVSITPRNEFPLTCRSTPFYDRNVLLPNGDVVLCCMDYDLNHVIGNLLTQTYEEIFAGEKLAEIIKMNEDPKFNKCHKYTQPETHQMDIVYVHSSYALVYMCSILQQYKGSTCCTRFQY
jgi:hypothetical protein